MIADQPLVSVVLPTHGRRDSLLRVLQALSRQTVDAGLFEVVVVCDGDTDGSVEACRALAQDLPYPLYVIGQENLGPAVARNRGVHEAHAPLIVFLDDDVVPDERLLTEHLDAHARGEQLVTIGPLLPPPDCRLSLWGMWEEKMLCRQYDAMVANRWHATYRQFYTGNAGVLKRHVLAVGGFNPAFRRAEDVDLALRLQQRGLHFTFLPGARGLHYVQRTFSAWQRLPAAYGAADVAMARQGHARLLSIIAQDYRSRHWSIRWGTQLIAGRASMLGIASLACGAGVRTAERLGMHRVGMKLCSLIFNLRYYDGLARELGGRHSLKNVLGGQELVAPIQGDRTQRMMERRQL